MDKILIEKAQKGDRESFTEAILQVKDQAYKIAYCYLHNEHDSMDAVCDAVEKAFIGIKKLKDKSFFTTWFIRIVINECKQQIRKHRTIMISDYLQDTVKTCEENIEGGIDLEILLDKLDPSDRILIYMKYYMGYTLEEIAEKVNLPAGTVKTRIYGNLRSIREKLELREV